MKKSVLAITASVVSLSGVAASLAAAPSPASPTWGFEIVRSYPHDPSAFTQGLQYVKGGQLIEGTGIPGSSTLRRVDLATGNVLAKVALPAADFGEGVAVLGGKVYQLTWKGRRGYVYDEMTFKREREFKYEGEGWGLTHDGKSLILSDGSPRIRFIDPKTFKVTRSIRVRDERGRPLLEINELEVVRGEIWANVWMTDRIARISPADGKLLGWIDLRGLGKPEERSSDPDGVLNGIAWDEAGDRVFVTGKFWRRIFEIRLIKTPPTHFGSTLRHIRPETGRMTRASTKMGRRCFYASARSPTRAGGPRRARRTPPPMA